MLNRKLERTKKTLEEMHHALGVLHYISVFLLGLGAALALTFSDLLSTIEDFVDRPTGPDVDSLLAVSVATLIGWLVAVFYFFRSAHWRRKGLKRGDRLNRLDAISVEFCKLADYHAKCDKNLFDLFLHEIAPAKLPKEATNTALYIVAGDIERVLDYAARIFAELTGHPCAACIKWIIIENIDAASDLRDAEVTTLRRDSHSRKDREKDDHNRKQNYLKENTADIAICTMGDDLVFRNDIWACDDLEALAQEGKYENSRKLWRDDYNATIVCGIENLGPKSDIPWRALFCVDNLGGGLDNRLSHYYARELSARLSVMIYRQHTLNMTPTKR